MRTARSGGPSRGCLHQATPPEQIPPQPGADKPWERTPPPGADTPRPETPRSRHPPGPDTPWEQNPSQEQSPPVNRITDACKNITLPQTSFAGGKKKLLAG